MNRKHYTQQELIEMLPVGTLLIESRSKNMFIVSGARFNEKLKSEYYMMVCIKSNNKDRPGKEYSVDMNLDYRLILKPSEK